MTTTTDTETKTAATTTQMSPVPEASARRRRKTTTIRGRNNTMILGVVALLFIVSRNDMICQTNSFKINSLSRRNCRKASFSSSKRQKNTGSITMSRHLLLWMYRETNNDEIMDSSFSSILSSSGTTSDSSSTVLVPKSTTVNNNNNRVRSVSKEEEERDRSQLVRRRNDNKKYLRTTILKHPLTGEETNVLLQTRIQRFQKLDGDTTIVIDLHAQVHFADSGYFQYYNRLNDEYDKILYELIVSSDLLYESSPDIRHLTLEASELLGSSVEAQQTAQMYGLCSQVDEMNYGSGSSSEQWICADYKREELSSLRHEAQKRRSSSSPPAAVVSTSSPLQEVVQAFWQPTTPSSVGDDVSTKEIQLFSNLFLKGKSITSFIRLMLWFLIPVPELSILILDWSSLNKPKPGGLSPLAIQTLSSLLLYGNIPIARKLVFAQIIVSGQNSSSSTSGSVEADPNMVLKRNDRAMKVLKQVIKNDCVTSTRTNESSSSSLSATTAEAAIRTATSNKHMIIKRYALLFGALHCNDLQRRLVEDLGFQSVDRSNSSSNTGDYDDSEWRTAWKIPLPQSQQSQRLVKQQPVTTAATAEETTGTKTDGTDRIDNTITTASNTTSNNNIPFFILWIALYLGISGVDWLAVWKDVGTSIEHTEWFEAFVIALFYLGRHAAMYFGLSKFLIEWDPNNSSSSATSNQ